MSGRGRGFVAIASGHLYRRRGAWMALPRITRRHMSCDAIEFWRPRLAITSNAVPRRGRMFAGQKRLRTPEKRSSDLTSLQASGPQPNAGLIPCVCFS